MIEIRSRFPMKPNAAYGVKVRGQLRLPFDRRQKSRQLAMLVSGEAVVAVGRFTFTLFRFTMLKLTSMNAASRKNMMSISGMISIRAFLCGMGEVTFIEDL